jgi:hypothetical protein
MKKIKFADHVAPHVIAVIVFVITTVLFFKPIFFDNKTLQQHDIQQFLGSAKSIVDYREETGEESLWADRMFSGMPAYLVSVQWGNTAIGWIKRVMTIGFPTAPGNILAAFISYYILLLAFGIRPYLAIAGAVAFGLSNYLIIGLMAGHNARVGAIAFMPLVVAGVHLVFTGKRTLGFGLSTAGLALHLRENHLQMTYYLFIILLVYGVVQIIKVIRQKTFPDFLKSVGVIVIGSLIAMGSFFGPMWAITDYQKYSIRGRSELVPQGATLEASGLQREYAFEYSNGILEPFVLMVPNFYGGSTSNYLVQDRESETFKMLSRSNDQELVNQLVNYTGAYWGPQALTAPYYGGAIMVFLFAVGIAFAERRYVYWLVPVSILGIVLSWGSNFSSFNYFLFDFLPGYNKFRSVTFTMIMTLFSMPLLGLLGIEKLWSCKFDKKARRKSLIAYAATGGLCLLFLLFSATFGFTREIESQLPQWLLDALIDDRRSLFLSDVFRSFSFITVIFIVIYFEVHKKISVTAVCAFLALMIIIDLAVVDKRYLTGSFYKRKRDNSFFAQTEADQAILRDKSYYRVYNIESPFQEARTSYHHNSIGGYHGAKLMRYQQFYDSCIIDQTKQLITDVQQGKSNFEQYGAINMLNVKYIVFGPSHNNFILNPSAPGPGWFVKDIVSVRSANEELQRTCSVNTKSTAVINGSQFKVPAISGDVTGTITLAEHKPSYLKYDIQSGGNGLVVFSEIYYPEWKATVDGNEVSILRADYLLRALEIPAGKHTVEFSFEPRAYFIGNKITISSSWIVLLTLFGSIGWSLRKSE